MAMKSNSNATSFTTVYQDSTSFFTTTAQTYQHSTYVPAGLLESVSLRWIGTSSAEMADGDYGNLLSQYIGRINGNQFANLNANAGDNDSVGISRIGAILESVGGTVSGNVTATGFDYMITIPVGLNIPNQSRYEGELRTGGSAVVPTANTFQVIFKYGFSDMATIYGNQTVQNISAAQTMVQVKVPNYGAGTRVIGVAIQQPNEDEQIAQIVCKPLGDFEASPAVWRERSGLVGGNQYYFHDADTGATVFQDALKGFLFIPTYGLDTSATGQLTFLVTGTGDVNNVSFTPILSLPTSGAGERREVKTQQVKTSGANAVLERAEQ